MNSFVCKSITFENYYHLRKYLIFYFIITSLGRSIRFSLVEKLEGTKNSFFEFDKKDAHHEKVLLLKIAICADLITLKSFLIESDLTIDICKLVKQFLSSLITSLPYL